MKQQMQLKMLKLFLIHYFKNKKTLKIEFKCLEIWISQF